MEQTTTERVAGQVRAILAQRRLTRRWLSDQVGMPLATIQRRLNGDVAFTVSELIVVARVLNIPVAALLPTEAESMTSGAA